MMDKSWDIVLVVDDSLDFFGFVIDVLKQIGVVVFVVISGEVVLLICDKVILDMILMDVVMFGLDGFDICRVFKVNLVF